MYQAKAWVNRAVDRPNTYKMMSNPDGTVTMTPAFQELAGTPLDATNMQRMDDGIEAAHREIESIKASTRSVSDVLLTTVNATQIATFTPPAAGNYVVYLYLRATEPLNVTTILTYSDGGGAQTNTVYDNQPITVAGSFNVLPLFINATTVAPITITVTSSVASALYVSASISGV